MNAAQAKDIDINDLLQRLGYQATKRTAKDTWYIRPYGEEKHASFHVSRDGRAWFDFGEGVGGNIIDLAMRLGDTSEVKDALSFIENAVGSTYVAPFRENKTIITEPTYKLIEARPFNPRSKAGAYLINDRGINAEQVAPYFRDVVYTDGKYKKKGFGMPNIAEGVETRQLDTWLKTTVGLKDVSVFQANREAAPWHCFYSMMDFGTFLTIDKPPVGVYNYLILNGDGMVEKAAAYLETVPPSSMIHYPHNDNSGQLAYHKLLDFLTSNDWTGGDRAHLYDGYKDWNEKLIKDKGIGQIKPVVIAPSTGLRNTPGLR